MNVTVEDIGEDANLLWIGEKRTDKVILYLHGEIIPTLLLLHAKCRVGGGFLIPLADNAPDLLRHIQLKLSDGKPGVGLVMLDFCKPGTPQIARFRLTTF